MEKKSHLKAGCGLLVFTEAASASAVGDNRSKAADSHKVAKKLISQPDIVFAHALLGKESLLTMVTGPSFIGAVKNLHEQVRGFQKDRHNYITETKTHTLTALYGQKPTKTDFELSAPFYAWVAASLSVADPEELTAVRVADRIGNENERLDYGAKILTVAPVIGKHDIFFLMEAESQEAFSYVLDHELRTSGLIQNTVTHVVTKEVIR